MCPMQAENKDTLLPPLNIKASNNLLLKLQINQVYFFYATGIKQTGDCCSELISKETFSGN